LRDGKIADSDRPDFSLLEQTAHRRRGLGNGRLRIGPVNLIDIDTVGLETFQGGIDLRQNPVAACVAKRLPILPVETHLGRNDRTTPQLCTGYGSADDVFGISETVNRRSIDEIHAVAERSLDGSNR